MARPIGSTGQARVLSQKEFRKVITLTKANRNHLLALRNTAILSLSFYLGLRVGEMSKLLISDLVDEDNNLKHTIRLKSGITKGKKHRDVYLSNTSLKRCLEEYLNSRHSVEQESYSRNSSLFVSQKRNTFTPRTLSQLIKTLFNNAHMEGATSHSGRRTFITNLATYGVDIKSIATLAGHASVTTTSHYIETNPALLSKISKRIW